MTENPENSGDLDPQTSPEDEPEIIDGNEEIIEDENNSAGIDPLAALRQDMLEEEQQPESNNRPDLLQRMTGTLGSRKVPTRPRPATNNDQNFAIRSSRHLPRPEPFIRPTQPQNEEIHDEFLEERLGTGPLNAPKIGAKQEPFNDSPIHIEGDPKAEGGLFTQSTPISSHQDDSFNEIRGRRRLDPLWDNTDEEEEANQEGKPTELFNRPLEERKMLGTGAERQYQVNKFLSYNPKRNLRERFQDLSLVEKILLVILILAVVIVTALIVFLYMSSRQLINLPQINLSPIVSATRAIEPTSVQTVPVPSGLRLTGGWNFQLTQGALKDGKWLPTSSEWLVGTEIRRVVALPWNRQLEAVVNSLEPNNPIELFMSNGDVFTYKVLSVSQVPVSDSSIMYDTRPSLAIILINPNSVLRLVVVAAP